MTSTTTSSSDYESRVAWAVNADWARVLDDGAAERHARTWPVLHEATGRDLDAVLRAVGGDRAVAPAVADANLATVVRLAAHDALAARIVLQRLVPGLVHAARRRRLGGFQAAFDELVGTAWVLVRTYPIDRRPTRVAANLCRDAEYHAFVRARRLRSADERPLGALLDDRSGRPVTVRPGGRRALGPLPVSVMRSTTPAAADEVGDLLVEAARAGFDRRSLALVAQIHLAGHHPRAVARELRMSERSVRMRRDATVRRLARLAAVA